MFLLAFPNTFLTYAKIVCLVIFLNRKQPVSLDMLQSELVTVQRWIQELCPIKKRALSNSI